MSDHEFQAMLRFWRRKRGFSQFELALEAGVSTRHLSFLETGRAKPSRAMLIRLMAPLSLQIREQHEVLRAAGFDAGAGSGEDNKYPAPIEWAIRRMMQKHEPFPLTVLSGDYSILRANDGARRLFGMFLNDTGKLPDIPNMYSLILDPQLARPFVENWPEVAEHMLARLTRECIARPTNKRLQTLRKTISLFPGLEKAWQQPDFGGRPEATLVIRLRRGGFTAKFLTTLTLFSAPWTIALEELRIESYYPLDEATAAFCYRLMDPAPEPDDNG
jgi:transcriptional regulator with XRE-family HTH domain